VKILYLTHRAPFPPDKGDRIRSYHTLRHLAANHDVYLACLADEPVTDSDRNELCGWSRDLAIVPIDRRRWLRASLSFGRGRTATEGLFASRPLRRVLQQWSDRYKFDVVLAYCSSMTQYLDLTCLRGIPAVADLVDLDSQKWLDYAALSRGPKRVLYRLEGHRLRCVENALTRRCRAVIFVSEREADLYRQVHPNDQTLVVPNGVDLDYFEPGAVSGCTEPLSCVFVGALDYHANIDGVLWFCRDVWPAVAAQLPAATLSIVGRSPVREIRALADLPGVRVFADVPDVRPYLMSSAVTIVPLRIARGLQNKVLEAMAMQRPVIATPQALGGIAAVPGKHVLAASTAAEWVRGLADLLTNDVKSKMLGTAARRFVEESYVWSNAMARLNSVLAEASRLTGACRDMFEAAAVRDPDAVQRSEVPHGPRRPDETPELVA
jgi:sugar transferase (PEP-CTERM/EpsH1 system associated)